MFLMIYEFFAQSPFLHKYIDFILRFICIFRAIFKTDTYSYWSFYLTSKIKGEKTVIISLSHESEVKFVEQLSLSLRDDPKIAVCFFSGHKNVDIKKLSAVLGKKFPLFHHQALNAILCDMFISTKSSLLWNRPWASLNVHVFHSAMSLHMYPEYSFDFYDTFFAIGPHHKRELETLLPKRGKDSFLIYEVGCEAIDSIYLANIANQENTSHSTIPTKVIFAPTHGRNSSLVLYGKEIIAALLSEGLKTTLRPHPISKKIDALLLREIAEQFPDIVLDMNSSSLDANQFDILITDWSGISLEFACGMKRPVIFIDVPQKAFEFNPNWKKYFSFPTVEYSCRQDIGLLANSPSDFLKILHKLKVDYSEQCEIVGKHSKYLCYNIGSSYQQSYKCIKKLLENEG